LTFIKQLYKVELYLGQAILMKMNRLE